jgi:hypothetical protein
MLQGASTGMIDMIADFFRILIQCFLDIIMQSKRNYLV